MAAIQKENVDVHFTGVASITADGVIGDDGVLRKCDTIVCATGEVFPFQIGNLEAHDTFRIRCQFLSSISCHWEEWCQSSG